MSQELLDHVSIDSRRKTVPQLKTGYTVRVHTKIKEGDKQRTQIFEGLVIAVNSGTGVSKTFTVRKVVDGVGVERIFPFFSLNIEKVEVVKAGKVRRSKLYFMRERSGKSARLREMKLTEVGEWGLGEEVPAEPEEAEAPAEEVTEQVEAPSEQDQTEEAAPESTETEESTEEKKEEAEPEAKEEA